MFGLNEAVDKRDVANSVYWYEHMLLREDDYLWRLSI